MEHGVAAPILFKLFDSQSLEKISFSLEVTLHHGDKQTLSESAGAAEEIELATLDEFVKQGRFVRIEIVIGADCLEILYANRILHA